MTFEDFSQVFAILAVQLRATDTDQATVRAYYNALVKLPLALVIAAADRLALTSAWFPKTSEWVTTATAIERERTVDVDRRLRASWRPRCAKCEDTGWVRQENPRQSNGWEVYRCACRVLRRDEVLGHVSLPPVEPEPGPPVDIAERMAMLRSMIKPLVQKSAGTSKGAKTA